MRASNLEQCVLDEMQGLAEMPVVIGLDKEPILLPAKDVYNIVIYIDESTGKVFDTYDSRDN